MITPRPLGSGSVVTTLGSLTPAAARLTVHDAAGRLVVRRRFHQLSLTLALATGRHTFSVEDERSPHDPSRLAGTTVTLDVSADGPDNTVATAALRLVPGAVVRATVRQDGAAGRFARVRATHADGHVVEARTDAAGAVALCGLRAGAWTLSATDARRSRCAAPITATVHAGDHTAVDLDLDTETAGLLVRVVGAGVRGVDATEVTATAADGSRVTAPLVGGHAHLRGLRPGAHTVVVPPSVGHLGASLVVPALTAGSLLPVDAIVPVGASVVGRVVDTGRHAQYAAVVALLDADGTEVERVRTDDTGRFVLGTGLGSVSGYTVVATSGPEELHVTRAAHADVVLTAGVRQDVGDLRLPSVGLPAVWTPRDRAIAAMKLPSTRV